MGENRTSWNIQAEQESTQMDGTGWVSHGLPASVFSDARDLQARLVPFQRAKHALAQELEKP